ncbi:hypothetical protein EDB86DRAFT_2826459 [Lactarius hatsudake]|nr:hypothetical protein EDB86DRAFT_2826459 [Lactarius hatsudake]
MASLIEKHDRQLAAASEPTGSPRRDELMDVDASLPSHSPSSDGHASQGLLPFPGNVVNGAHEVAHVDLTNLSCAGLQELCDAFRLAKTGNKTTLTDQLKDFSADRQGWDGSTVDLEVVASRRALKGPGKKASTKKWSTLRHELLFSAATAAGMGSTTQPCLPTERSKDMRTDEERAAVLVWADNFVACNPYKPPEAENKFVATRRGSRLGQAPRASTGDTSNAPSSPSPKGPQTALQLQLQQVQAQLAALMAAIAGGNSGGVAPSPVTVMKDPDPWTAPQPPRTLPPQPRPRPQPTVPLLPLRPISDQCRFFKAHWITSSSETAGRSALRSRAFPTLPLVSFARDLPRLMRTWDDSSPEWTPSEAVLRIQGEPIALKHWPTVYRYSKSGQWACTKKNWAHWRDIATSWQELTETSFWQKFTADGQPMSYTAICEALRRSAWPPIAASPSRPKTSTATGFGAAFGYRRGSEHIVRNKSSAIARHYRSLHVSSD